MEKEEVLRSCFLNRAIKEENSVRENEGVSAGVDSRDRVSASSVSKESSNSKIPGKESHKTSAEVKKRKSIQKVETHKNMSSKKKVDLPSQIVDKAESGRGNESKPDKTLGENNNRAPLQKTTTSKHNCNRCAKAFRSAHGLEEHKCLIKSSLMCKVCDRSFRSRILLEEHIMRYHNDNEVEKNLMGETEKHSVKRRSKNVKKFP